MFHQVASSVVALGNLRNFGVGNTVIGENKRGFFKSKYTPRFCLITMVIESPNWGYSPSKWPKWLVHGGY